MTRTIAVFGGSFNPPGVHHRQIATLLAQSFDEVVVVLQLADVKQRTIPRQMFSGIREQISPTILAVATILVIISIMLLATVEMLRRRSERMRGISPG